MIIFERMKEKKSHTKCPKCGFDYAKLKPTSTLVPCPKCGGSFADISEDYIRIITHDQKEIPNEIQIKFDDLET